MLFQLLDSLLRDMARLAFVKFLELTTLVAGPSSELGIRCPVRRDHAVSVAFLVVGELSQTFQPRGFVGVPAESNLIQRLGSFLCHVRRLVLLHESVMTSLLLHPQAELGKCRVRQWNMAVSVLFLERNQIIHVAFPGRFLCVPRKIQLLKFLHAFVGDTGWLAILQQFVLFAVMNEVIVG